MPLTVVMEPRTSVGSPVVVVILKTETLCEPWLAMNRKRESFEVAPAIGLVGKMPVIRSAFSLNWRARHHRRQSAYRLTLKPNVRAAASRRAVAQPVR